MRRTIFVQDQRGFTLVELLIASALLVPLMITLFLMVETLQRAYSRGEQRADLQQSARIAMARMVRELRAAGFDPEAVIPQLPVPTAIQTAEASRIAFIADPDGDGKKSKKSKKSMKIEYRLDLSADPPVLRRQQWPTWNSGWSGSNGGQPLAERITGVEFTYYGADGTPISSSELPTRLGEIQRVGLVITAGSPPGQSPPETYRLVSAVRIRNAGL